MSEYLPYIPEIEDGFAKPDPATQLLLQDTYGWIMHRIKDALDELIHVGAEQAIIEFNYAQHYDEPKTHELVEDYLAEMMDSPWSEDKAREIAGELGPDAPKSDIDMALYSILRASHARLHYATRNNITLKKG